MSEEMLTAGGIRMSTKTRQKEKQANKQIKKVPNPIKHKRGMLFGKLETRSGKLIKLG